MAMLASQLPASVSLHAAPLGGSEMPERFRGSYVSAPTLTAEANFSGQAQRWHVIGNNGVTVRFPFTADYMVERRGPRD